jgi:hypothetical protein
MPEHADYVDFLFHPMNYSVWWVLGGGFAVALIALWIAAAFIWTLPVDVLRGIPVIREVTFRVLRLKFERSLASIAQRHRDGQLTTREAYHQISRTFRLFVSFRTGYSAPEMTATDISDGPLAGRVLDVLRATYPGQFDTADPNKVSHAVDVARKAVATWR